MDSLYRIKTGVVPVRFVRIIDGMNAFRSTLVASLFLTAFAHGQTPDYPGAFQYLSAASSNYGSRPAGYTITNVTCHIMEGSYAGSISWFQNPSSVVSAHYMIRSSDGQITQMVRETNRAFHSGISYYNNYGIGIEHEARSGQPQWHTDAMYWASGNLTRYLTTKYNIPRTRNPVVNGKPPILGHKETGAATSCPGPEWDWNRYMAIVQNAATFTGSTVPGIVSGNAQFEVVLNFQNDGADNWLASGTDPVLLGTSAASNYFVASDWISSTRATGPTATTAPGATGEFRFLMKAPATTGSYTETFQLFRNSVGFFGPTVTVNITVNSADLVIDNTSANFSATGAWNVDTAATNRYGTNCVTFSQVRKTNATATWALNAPATGLYEVYAWWADGTSRNPAAQYMISATREGGTYVFVDQRTRGGQWNSLGRVRLRQGTGMVRLFGAGEATGTVVADAVRLVGPL